MLWRVRVANSEVANVKFGSVKKSSCQITIELIGNDVLNMDANVVIPITESIEAISRAGN